MMGAGMVDDLFVHAVHIVRGVQATAPKNGRKKGREAGTRKGMPGGGREETHGVAACRFGRRQINWEEKW